MSSPHDFGRPRPVSQRSTTAALAAGTAFAVYSLVIPAIVGLPAIEVTSPWTSAAYVLIALTIYSGTRIAFELAQGGSRWLAMTFHSFAYVFLGVVPLTQIAARSLIWAINPTTDTVFSAAVVCLLGVLLFDLGSVLGALVARSRAGLLQHVLGGAREGAGSEHDPTRDLSRGSAVPMANLALAIMVALALLSVVLLWAHGGLGLILASRDQMSAALCPTASSGDMAGCGIVTALIRVPPVFVTLLALGLSGRTSGFVRWVALIVGIATLGLTANPVSSPRFWFGAVAIGLYGATLGRSLRSRLLMWLAIPALLILVFPSLDFGRREGWTPGFSIQTEAIVDKADFDAFQQVVNGVTYVDWYGTQGGRQLSSALLFFVPRGMWQGKAPPTGTLVVASLGVTGNTNVSAPLWEEGYVDFGMLGTAVLLACAGLLVGYLEAGLRVSARARGVIPAVVPFLAGYGMFILRGSLLPAIGTLVFALLLVWVSNRLIVEPSAARWALDKDSVTS